MRLLRVTARTAGLHAQIYLEAMDTILMTPEEIEVLLKGSPRPLPDRPGLWAFHSLDGDETEIRVRWLDLNEGDVTLTSGSGEPVKEIADSGTWGRYLGS